MSIGAVKDAIATHLRELAGKYSWGITVDGCIIRLTTFYPGRTFDIGCSVVVELEQTQVQLYTEGQLLHPHEPNFVVQELPRPKRILNVYWCYDAHKAFSHLGAGAFMSYANPELLQWLEQRLLTNLVYLPERSACVSQR